MTLTLSKSKNATSLYVTKCFRENGRRTTKVIEKLNNLKWADCVGCYGEAICGYAQPAGYL